MEKQRHVPLDHDRIDELLDDLMERVLAIKKMVRGSKGGNKGVRPKRERVNFDDEPTKRKALNPPLSIDVPLESPMESPPLSIAVEDYQPGRLDQVDSPIKSDVILHGYCPNASEEY